MITVRTLLTELNQLTNFLIQTVIDLRFRIHPYWCMPRETKTNQLDERSQTSRLIPPAPLKTFLDHTLLACVVFLASKLFPVRVRHVTISLSLRF